jgi:hypothetical protein
VQESETSSTRKKETTKLKTIKETKLKCIRKLEPKSIKQLTNIHATNGEIILMGKHQRERETYGSTLAPREGS